MASAEAAAANILEPPRYCQYAAGACDQSFAGVPARQALFLYSSDPVPIAEAIDAGIEEARYSGVGTGWSSWRDLPIAGKIIFCEVCKAMRHSTTIVADVTTMNFNLMFEIGFAIGLGLPLIPIRDTTYSVDQREFEQLGILDTLGYIDFTNGPQLAEQVAGRLPGEPLHKVDVEIAFDAPLYLLPGPMQTQGDIRLMSAIKKSRMKFRTFDPVESPRLSLTEAHRQVARSVGVIAHQISPNREGARAHNALCALVCGMAMAEQKTVLMLQEETTQQPIDFRDVVRGYDKPSQIVGLIEDPLLQVFEDIQTRRVPGRPRPANLLQRLDLGDPAAENEITALDDYFVETGQYFQARQGHARLVIGRKGSGKTAIFYAIRNPLIDSPSRLIMDLRPEGYQFTKLREFVLSKLSLGNQEHTMTAFWNVLLWSEMARKILVADRHFAERDPGRFGRFQAIDSLYRNLNPMFDADFSQRLLAEVDRIAERVGGMSAAELGPSLTEHLFTGDTKDIEAAVIEYLREKQEVWLLIDNIDKSWPTHGSTDDDIMIVRGLLEATRKIQERLEDKSIKFRCLVFLRTDIYTHLLRAIPDKGKDTAITVEWQDSTLFEEVVASRVRASTELDGSFGEMWPQICESFIKIQDTFDYIVERTLMRPRDLLKFLRYCVDMAINRGHEKIDVEDILLGEKAYSTEMVYNTASEIADTNPDWGNVLYRFQSQNARLSLNEVKAILSEVRPDLDDDGLTAGIDLLMRFGFLGVTGPGFADPAYAHSVGYDMERLWEPFEHGSGQFVVHPAFGEALALVKT